MLRAPMPAPDEPALPLLERFGLAVLRSAPIRAAIAGADDPIHVLNPHELRELRRIERLAVLRAVIAGALSGAASAGAAIWAQRFLGPEGAPLSAADGMRFWGVVLCVTTVASILEIAFLYWDALRSVHAMAGAAGLGLSAAQLSGEQRDVALALARAALELPNPPHRVFGVNPRRESIGWLVAGASLLYKAKVALTTFLLKLVLRSLLGRVLARSLFELVTIPVTAAWNGVICFLIVREARLRTMGPSAASEMVRVALSEGAPSAAGRAAVFRAVASAIVRTQDLHPNHLALLRALVERLGAVDIDEVDDSARFLSDVGGLNATDRRLVLRMLVVAAVLDGKLTRAERRLLHEAFDACRIPLEFRRIEALRRAFYSGSGLDFELLRQVADTD